MNTKIIVNYYPGSVGDAFIAHTFPFIKYLMNDDKSYRLINVFGLKNPNWPKEISKEEILYQIEKYKIITCHRFEEFDFSFIPNVKVISIDPSGYEKEISLRNLTKLKYGKKDFATVKSQAGKILTLSLECKEWKKTQILKTDIVLSLADLINHQNKYFIEWKNQNNLNELEDLSDEFYQHLKKSLNLE